MLEKSTQYIRDRVSSKPKVGIVLGSGLGAFANEMEVEVSLSYDEIPEFAPPTVVGHNGSLNFGKVEGVDVAVLQGRIHYYEGHSMEKIVHPVRTLAMLGVESLLLTNSAGGMAPNMNPGDFMIIEDHINLMGSNPLMGPNFKHLGPRFPDMTEAYDRKLISLLEDAMKQHQVNFHKGIYCGVSGPTYETPAEIRYLTQIGGHAVGMSTVPETIAANHMGLRVAAVSCITNKAAGLSQQKLTHDEVTTIAKQVEKTFCRFIKDFIGAGPFFFPSSGI